MAKTAYEFGGFRFEPFNLRLLHQDQVLSLTGKATDTLLVLVQHPDTLVTKEAVIQAVWPDIAVEENNLNQQISVLRKVLAQTGERELIETVARRGYRFVGPVRAIDVAGLALLTAETPRLEPARRTARAFRWLVVAAAAAIVLAVGLGLGWRWSETWRLQGASRAAEARASELMRANNARGAAAELQEAIRLNPNNAQAYGALAHALNSLAFEVSSSAYRPAGQSPSVEAARRSVELDPNCGECHGTLGMFLFYHDWEWAKSEAHYREAIRLEPDAGGIRASHAMLLSALGRNKEALQEIEFALRQNPYQLTWLGIRASILYLGRQYHEAIAAADQALLIAPKNGGAWETRSKALFLSGRGAEAVKALAQEPFGAYSAALDNAVREGGPEAGLRLLLDATGDWRGKVEHSWRRGPWRALLHDPDGALEEVERAYQARRLNAIYLGVDPVYDGIRNHPRFQKVLEGMGLKDLLGQHGETLDAQR